LNESDKFQFCLQKLGLKKFVHIKTHIFVAHVTRAVGLARGNHDRGRRGGGGHDGGGGRKRGGGAQHGAFRLADVVVGVAARLVVEGARRPHSGRQHELHAILDAVQVVGLSRQPVDARVGERRVGRAPPEVERTTRVHARRPENPIRVLHVNCVR
jgi:hypothetical protein